MQSSISVRLIYFKLYKEFKSKEISELSISVTLAFWPACGACSLWLKGRTNVATSGLKELSD